MCAGDGYLPVILDCDSQALATAREQLADRCRTFQMDLANKEQVKAALSMVAENGMPVTALVMSAAVHGSCPVEYLPDETIDRMVDVNLVAHIKFVRDAIKTLDDGAKIIAVSSVSATIGIPMQSLYSATKAGLEMFYESLGGELAYREIQCSVVQPGNVNTGFNETGNEYQPAGVPYLDEMYAKIVANIDSRYGMPPEKVATCIMRAIRSSNTKPCYIVGQNALKAHWAKRLLGKGPALKVMRKVMGLPDPAGSNRK